MTTVGEVLSLGLKYHQAGQFAHAEEIYRQVLAEHPGNGDALHFLGALALQTGRRDEAISLLQHATAADPTQAVYFCNLASAYLVGGRHEEARSALDEAIRLDANLADAHYNLGVALYNLGRLDEAVASYRRCLELQPGNPMVLNNLGDLLREQGKFSEAIEALEQSLAADPQYTKAHYNRSLVWLSQGRWAEGFREYEWRWQCIELQRRKHSQPEWDGAPLADKTLLIHAEQGLGDTLQLIRYVRLVEQRAARVIIEAPAALLPILTQSGFRDLYAPGAALPSFDAQLSLASLPCVFGTTVDRVPAPVPYLRAKDELIALWRERLAHCRDFKIGIAWQGAPTYREDRYRSIPLPMFAPLAAVPGVQLFSLQRGPGVEQLTALKHAFHVVDLGSQLDQQSGPFMDTAAVMLNLDLVITSDTAIAHLAGALGVPVWLALRIAPDWRWLLERDDSPWYPTMRLFRQRAFGDWPGVFQQMAAALGQRARG